MRRSPGLFLSLLCLCGGVPALGQEVIAEGLLPGMAVLSIDGRRVTLRPGQSSGSVVLRDVAGDHAIIEIDGVERRIGLSQRVGSSFQQPESRSVSIRRNDSMQYVTSAEINGRRVNVLVDTGANVIAMNREQARSLGISDSEGELGQVLTASDVRASRLVKLRAVNVGGLEVRSVEATILDGSQPAVILLGMSFLRHVELEERDGILTLRRRW